MSKVQFRDMIESIFINFLISGGFHFEKEVSASGSSMDYVIYGSEKIRLKFYRDVRNGEINCMVHLFSVKDATKPNQQSGHDWQFLPELCGEANDKNIEELLRSVPDIPLSDMEQLNRLKVMVERNLPKINV